MCIRDSSTIFFKFAVKVHIAHLTLQHKKTSNYFWWQAVRRFYIPTIKFGSFYFLPIVISVTSSAITFLLFTAQRWTPLFILRCQLKINSEVYHSQKCTSDMCSLYILADDSLLIDDYILHLLIVSSFMLSETSLSIKWQNVLS